MTPLVARKHQIAREVTQFSAALPLRPAPIYIRPESTTKTQIASEVAQFFGLFI